MKILKTVWAAICLLAAPAIVQAQIELPQVADFGGAISFATAGNGKSVQVSVTNGVKTIKAVDGEERCEIVDDPENGITVKLTQRFGPDDADKIEKTMPGLYMHLKSIPKNVDGAKVDIHVDVTHEYEADDKEDLEAKHPEAFKAYEKYANAQNGIRFGRVGGVRVLAPEIIRLDDVRVDLKKLEAIALERVKELRLPEIGGMDLEIIDLGQQKKSDDEAKDKAKDKTADEKSEKKDSKSDSDEKKKKGDKKSSDRRNDT